jgi:hypothetical protein
VKIGTFEVSYRLVIDCEDKLSGEIWRGQFLQKYIEDICVKAKNPKQFAVFIKMLLAGLKREVADEISLDLLT